MKSFFDVKKSGTQRIIDNIPNMSVDQKIVAEKLSVMETINPPIIAPNARPIVSINEPTAIMVPLFSGKFTSIKDEYQFGPIPIVNAKPRPNNEENTIHKKENKISLA